MQETLIIDDRIVPTKARVEEWCQHYVAKLLALAPEKIGPDVEFDRFGLDSAMAVAMCLDLEEWVGLEIPPALLFEYTTIAGLAGYVADTASKEVPT